jgi:GNAT superfamily N-acetyltransferase
MSRMDTVLAATQADLFWLDPVVRRLDRPDVLAVADGSERLLHNQVVRTRTAASAIPALVDAIQSFHTGVSQWLVVPDTPMDALERTLPEHGYAPSFVGDAFTWSTDGDLDAPIVDVRQALTPAAVEAGILACHAGFERDPLPFDLDREVRGCTGPDARVARFVAYVDGEPVGSANINRFDDLSFGFLWAGAVVPHARGRGVYRALLAARIRWARAKGLAAVGLYARRSTSGPIVAANGFTRHGPMTYWSRSAR